MKKMKPYIFFITSILIFLLLSFFVLFYTTKYKIEEEDVVTMKRIGNEASLFYPHVENGDYSFSTYDFSIIDIDGNILYQSSKDSITDINTALRENYTTLSFFKNENVVGTVIINNKLNASLQNYKHNISIFIIFVSALTLFVFCIYSWILIEEIS